MTQAAPHVQTFARAPGAFGQMTAAEARGEPGALSPFGPGSESAPDVTSVRHDPAAPQARTDAPRAVPAQIIEALRKSPDGSVELRLSPDELGRVKMTVSPGADGGVTVAVLVERPETLDLIRRHSDSLLADLKGEGFDNPTLDFRQEGQTPDGAPEDRTPPPETPLKSTSARHPTTDTAPPPRRLGDGQTLDLRM